jgi:hypothetical protein
MFMEGGDGNCHPLCADGIATSAAAVPVTAADVFLGGFVLQVEWILLPLNSTLHTK